MYQRKIRNNRYKPFYKQWLLDLLVDIEIDGVSTRDIPTNELSKDYKNLVIKQWSNRQQKYIEKKPISNTADHDKGILKQCTYYQVSISRPHDKSIGIPLHRIVYVWFNDCILPYNENNEKMEICHINCDSSNNHILNLTWDTAKNNRAQRKGAINQYGLRKNDRT